MVIRSLLIAVATLSLATGAIAQECRCGQARPIAADRDAIGVLEPIPTARIVDAPDDNWTPPLAPGERLVPGSVRIRYVGSQVESSSSRLESSSSRVIVQSPTAQAPAPAPQTYAAPAPSSSCYSSSYSGQYSYSNGATPQLPAPPQTSSYAYPPRNYAYPPPSANPYYGAPMYAEPAPRARRRPRIAIGQNLHLRIAAQAELHNRSGIGAHLLGPSAMTASPNPFASNCGPWGCR